jgi:hypothetical protein
MADETIIKIKMTPKGDDYILEVDETALKGTRKDQLIAQYIYNFDKMSRDENFQRAWEQFRTQMQHMPPQGGYYGHPYGMPAPNYPPPPNPYGHGGPYGNPYGGWGQMR